MTEHIASRTLVKSPPELWAECSNAASLARHLDQFGDIKITRLDPETAVAWEGERARGTVRIEPSGWGTKVILTAVAVEEEQPESVGVVGVVEVVEAPDAPEPADTPPPRRRRFGLFRFRRAPAAPEQVAEPEPESVVEPPEPEPTPEPEPPPETEIPPEPALEETIAATATATATATDSETTEAALTAALDSLGQAHHRPYSRA
jgi:hypothetical protein